MKTRFNKPQAARVCHWENDIPRGTKDDLKAEGKGQQLETRTKAISRVRWHMPGAVAHAGCRGTCLMNPCTDGADGRRCKFDTSLGYTESFDSETLSQTREIAAPERSIIKKY